MSASTTHHLPFIRLHANDDVLIARQQLIGGTQVEKAVVKGLIPAGHKIAATDIAAGSPIRRYNQIIGFASKAIQAGEHVHVHNCTIGEEKGSFSRDYAFCEDVQPERPKRSAQFMGYQRKNSRVATRNYIGILSSVNCSATVVRAIADHFSRRTNAQALQAFANIDGVVALTHGTGCGMDHSGQGMQLLRRTLAGYATHANFAGVLVVGLGCETNQLAAWLDHSHLDEHSIFRIPVVQLRLSLKVSPS
jgi:altronate hydrolase